jgi:16S rRNA (cytosine967-C5)-methyltransferase
VRGSALRILARVDRGGAYADILLDREQGRFPDPRDRALLTELVMGTLRRRGTLDHALSSHLSKPIGRTDAAARNALRLGAYQLFYMRVPERAALHETVEAAKEMRGERIGGLVNAVLRAVLRSGKALSLPREAGAERMAVELSAPRPLVEALARSLGEAEAASFLAASLDPPPFVVRANPFRTSREALLSRLAARGLGPSPCRYAPDGLLLAEPGGVHADPGFRSGEYLVMDEGAQLIAPLLAPAAGEELLDACASPGGKATQLAALAGGSARVVAADLPRRTRALRETVSRLGARGIEVVAHDFSAGPLPATCEKFDGILVDAPCTGMGVVRRNPDAKWRFDPADPARLARLQLAILSGAWPSLRPGGLLVYCTCSPLREENEDVVRAFVAATPGAAVAPGGGPGPPGRPGPRAAWPGPPDAWTPEGFVRLYPHRHGTDGFFAALLLRES